MNFDLLEIVQQSRVLRHTYAVDAVCVSDQDRFVSGGQAGS